MGSLIIYCEHIKGFIKVVFVVNFHHLEIFIKKNLCFGFDIIDNLLTFLCHWHNKSIVTPLLHDKTNMITMWDVMEYAIHTHYTQFFWNFNWNFKKVTWIWNQFIFQFWNEKFILLFLNMKVHISILNIIISI